MIVEIDKDGCLKVNGKHKYCPRTYHDERCGTWCALFGEPFALFPLKGEPEKKDRVCICDGKTLVSEEEIKDMRE